MHHLVRVCIFCMIDLCCGVEVQTTPATIVQIARDCQEERRERMFEIFCRFMTCDMIHMRQMHAAIDFVKSRSVYVWAHKCEYLSPREDYTFSYRNIIESVDLGKFACFPHSAGYFLVAHHVCIFRKNQKVNSISRIEIYSANSIAVWAISNHLITLYMVLTCLMQQLISIIFFRDI